MKRTTNREVFYRCARTRCIEVLDIEPTQEQIAAAADATDILQRQSDGLFMYGFELSQQALRVVAEANGIPPSEYEIKPERKTRKRK